MTWLRSWHEAAARRELASLSNRLLDKVVVTPAGVAAIDQHAAAVWDILSVSPGRVGAIELAGYAKGVEDTAVRNGWSPVSGGDFAEDWVGLRLAAACSLAAASRTDFQPLCP